MIANEFSFDDILTIIRIVCILLVATFQGLIAYSLWQFDKKGVSYISMPQWAAFMVISSLVLTLSATLLIINHWIIGD